MDLSECRIIEDDVEVKALLVQHGRASAIEPLVRVDEPTRAHVTFTKGETLYIVTRFYNQPNEEDNGYLALIIPLSAGTPEELGLIARCWVQNGQNGPTFYSKLVKQNAEAC
jgi:hypothetical protein